MKILAVLNARAGSLIGRDGEEIRSLVEKVLARGGARVSVRLASGKDIIREIKSGAESDCDTLVIGGGDGSVNCAAGMLTGSQKTLGVLPLGTMNLLARDLGMPTKLEDALEALSVARSREIDLARRNGKIFHTLSGLGFFSQMARAREEVRSLPGKLMQVTAAAWRAFTRAEPFSVQLDIDGNKRNIETYALLVTVNRFSGDAWRRVSLDEGLLECHFATDKDTVARFKAGADLLTGGWRQNPGIKSVTASRVRVERARRHIWVTTDGELSREHMPLDYSILPKAIRVLVPEENKLRDKR
jgi:diacylglycerol kinase family enzyme